MNCRHCGKEVPDDANFCVHCGRAVRQAPPVETFVCLHCGTEIPIDKEYCPNCAEPRPKPELSVDEIYVNKKSTTGLIVGIVSAVFLQIFCLFFGLFGLIYSLITIPPLPFLSWYGFRRQALIDLKKNSRETIIEKQYMMDQTSVCKYCGSHDIKVYRNGYNYSMGYWLRKYGGGYIAGMDSNRARCRCQNCGYDWLTDYDYRVIK